MRRALPYFFLTLIVFGMLTASVLLHPEEARKWIVRFDVLNLTPDARAESLRQAQIRAIPTDQYWKTEALLHGQVFKGASPEMTLLALGQPVEHIDLDVKSHGVVTIMIYRFENSQRYTMLQFIDGRLDLSQQIAAPDVEMYRRDPRRVEPRNQAILPIAAQAVSQ